MSADQAGSARGPAPPGGSRVPSPPGTGAFLGRDRELAALAAGLVEAREGRGRLFLLVGEPGIGKTRLADELAARAGPEARVLWGRCWEAGGAPAFWPWVEVLRALVAAGDPAALAADLGAAATVVAALVPELRERLPGLPAAARDDSENARFVLFDAVAGFLRKAAARAPLVIVLDDLHSADRPSLLLLQFVARSLRGARILIVGTYRDADARLTPPVAELLARIEREGERLPLGRLGAEDVAAFVRLASGAPADERVVAAVVSATEGTPLFVTEVVRLMAAHGAAAGPLPARLLVPDGLQPAIRGHLAQVSDEAREALRVAAVIGREFEAALLGACLDRPDPDLGDRLAEAARAGLVVEMDAPPPRLRFAHILIRETLYRDLGAAERRRLHARVAAALEAAGGAEARAAELAHHHLAAGPEARAAAVAWSRRAGERAMSTYAYEEAIAHFERALEVTEAIDDRAPPDRGGRCELLLALAGALQRSGDRGRAVELCQRAADEARALGAADLLARAALTYGAEFTFGIVDPKLVGLLGEALGALGEEPTALRARLMARLGAAEQPAPDPDRPTALARDAVALARRVGDRATLVAVLRDARAAYLPMDSLEERLALDLETLALAYETRDRTAALHAQRRLAIDRLEEGQVAAALAHIDQHDRIADELRQPVYRAVSLAARAGVSALAGRFAEAERALDEAAALAAGLQDVATRTTVAAHRLGLLRAACRDDEMMALEAQFADVPGGASGREARFIRLVVASRTASAAALRAEIGPFRALAKELSPRMGGQGYMAEIAALAGDEELSAMLYDRLRPWARRCFVFFGCEGSWSRILGLLAAALGRTEDARRHFEDAVAHNEAIGARPWVAQTLAAYADLLLATGEARDRRRAGELQARARALAGELGMPGLLARLGEAVAVAPAGPARPAEVDASAALRREGEYWTVAFEGRTARLRHGKGLEVVAYLVRHPGREFHVLHLAAIAEGDAPAEGIAGGDAGPALDATAKQAYRRRLEDLDEALREAEAFGDAGRAARAREERELLARELARGVGLGGRDRREASAAERARVNVQRRISDALKKIDEACPPLGRHLQRAIRTGSYCAYDPA